MLWVKEFVRGMNGFLTFVEGMNVKWGCAPPHLTTKVFYDVAHNCCLKGTVEIKLCVVSTLVT